MKAYLVFKRSFLKLKECNISSSFHDFKCKIHQDYNFKVFKELGFENNIFFLFLRFFKITCIDILIEQSTKIA